jgi:DNA-binding CsgD family transcriptional regulator
MSATGKHRHIGKRAHPFRRQSSSRIRQLVICRMQIWRPTGFDDAPWYKLYEPLHQEVDPLVRLVLAGSPPDTFLPIAPWWEDTVKTATAGPEVSRLSRALPPSDDSLQNRGAGMDLTYRPYLANLSARELEILLLVAEGLPNKGIADRLIIAESTVKWYLKQIYLKLDVHNRAQAIKRLHAQM